jgi:hypothetical protein
MPNQEPGEIKDSNEAVEATAPVADIKPMNALLSPAATVLGEFLGEKVEAWISNKRTANLHKHIAAVKHKQTRNAESPPPKVETPDLLSRWEDGASKFDPDTDREMAAVWQGILAAIRDGDVYAEEDLKTLEKLSPADILSLIYIENRSVFFGFGLKPRAGTVRRDHLSDPVRLQRLRAAGVTSPRWKLQRILSTIYIGLAAMMFAVILMSMPTLVEARFLPETGNSDERLSAAWILVTTSVLVFPLALYLTKIFQEVTTAAGDRILELYREYADAWEDKQRYDQDAQL